jgi:hypothetical protein
MSLYIHGECDTCHKGCRVATVGRAVILPKDWLQDGEKLYCSNECKHNATIAAADANRKQPRAYLSNELDKHARPEPIHHPPPNQRLDTDDERIRLGSQGSDVRVMHQLRGEYNPPRAAQRLPSPIVVSPLASIGSSELPSRPPIPPAPPSEPAKVEEEKKSDDDDKEKSRFSWLEVD